MLWLTTEKKADERLVSNKVSYLVKTFVTYLTDKLKMEPPRAI